MVIRACVRCRLRCVLSLPLPLLLLLLFASVDSAAVPASSSRCKRVELGVLSGQVSQLWECRAAPAVWLIPYLWNPLKLSVECPSASVSSAGGVCTAQGEQVICAFRSTLHHPEPMSPHGRSTAGPPSYTPLHRARDSRVHLTCKVCVHVCACSLPCSLRARWRACRRSSSTPTRPGAASAHCWMAGTVSSASPPSHCPWSPSRAGSPLQVSALPHTASASTWLSGALVRLASFYSPIGDLGFSTAHAGFLGFSTAHAGFLGF